MKYTNIIYAVTSFIVAAIIFKTSKDIATIFGVLGLVHLLLVIEYKKLNKLEDSLKLQIAKLKLANIELAITILAGIAILLEIFLN